MEEIKYNCLGHVICDLIDGNMLIVGTWNIYKICKLAMVDLYIGNFHLHNEVLVPEEVVRVEVGGWVEPKRDALLTVALALGKHVGLQKVRLPGAVAQEFEVHLVLLLTV